MLVSGATKLRSCLTSLLRLLLTYYLQARSCISGLLPNTENILQSIALML